MSKIAAAFDGNRPLPSLQLRAPEHQEHERDPSSPVRAISNQSAGTKLTKASNHSGTSLAQVRLDPPSGEQSDVLGSLLTTLRSQSTAVLDDWTAASEYLETTKGWIRQGNLSIRVDKESSIGRARLLAFWALKSGWFDFCIGGVIMVNCVTIGIELQDPHAAEYISVMEDLFLCVYIVELFYRVFVLGVLALQDNWVRFDGVLVISGILTQWTVSEENMGPGEVLNLLRIMRLFRLARTLKLVNHFNDLGMMVRGMLQSGAMMCYTFMLLFLMIYIFACVGLEVVGKHPLATGPRADPDFQAVTERHFRDLWSSMLTLVQFVCLDSVGPIYEPLVKKSPMLSIYFMLVILVVGIVLMNMILGVIVNTAIDLAKDDHAYVEQQEAKKRKKLIRELRHVFRRLDEDRSDTISLEELTRMDEEDRRKMARVLNQVDIEVSELFGALDLDGSGSVDIDEFCDGIWQVSVSHVPIESKRMEREVTLVREQLKEISHKQSVLMERQVQHMEAQQELRECLQVGCAPRAKEGSEAPEAKAQLCAAELLLRLECQLAEFRREALKLPCGFEAGANPSREASWSTSMDIRSPPAAERANCMCFASTDSTARLRQKDEAHQLLSEDSNSARLTL